MRSEKVDKEDLVTIARDGGDEKGGGGCKSESCSREKEMRQTRDRKAEEKC